MFVIEKGASGPLFNLNSIIHLLVRKLFNIMGLLDKSFPINLSFTLVGNPFLIQKDSLLSESPEATGQAGMTDFISCRLLRNSLLSVFFILLISIPGFSYAEEMEKVNKNTVQTMKRNKIVVQNQLEMNKTDKKGIECQPIYGNYWRSSKWGWYGARRVVKTPVEAKEILEQFLLHNRGIRVVKIVDKPHFFVAEIINSRGTIIDLILIDKRTGRIRSMF